MFIKTCKRKHANGEVYETHYLTEGYRDPKTGKVKHKHLVNLGKLPKDLVFLLKEAIKKSGSGAGEIEKVNLKEMEMLCSKEYGSVAVFEKLFHEHIGDCIGRKYKDQIKAIVINKILEPKSKNALPNWLRLVDLSCDTSDKNAWYQALDYLEKKQEHIEQKLFEQRKKKHPETKCQLYLYDITSTYFEGKGAENICKHGYSRDHRPDRIQVNIGLVTDEEGFPLTVEILEGNITDKQTLQGKIEILKERFGIEEVTFVFDRGMKTKANLEHLTKEGYQYITALSHAQLQKKAAENEKIQMSLFDKKDLVEFLDEDKGKKYVLSHNPSKARLDQKTRIHLIEKTEKSLQKIKDLKKSYTDAEIQDKVSRVINRYKCEKYLEYTIESGILSFERNTEKIEIDEQYDGFYMIESTNTEKSGEEIEQTYKNLQMVERAFDDVKNHIEIRPVFHYKESRIKGHIFSCFLSYYLLHAFRKNTAALLKSYSLDTLLTELRDIKKAYFKINCFAFEKISNLSDLQKNILSLSGVRVVTPM